MAKIKFTKSELKKQRDSLKQFLHYLPTLQLKKQQLQIRIADISKRYQQKKSELNLSVTDLKQWVGLLADPGVDISDWIIPQEISTTTENIAGSEIPVFQRMIFKEQDYDLYQMPLWVDEAIKRIREWAVLTAEARVLEKQKIILEKELAITTQRVNLFEKIKIPQCVENIRQIRIYLGDQLANAVGVSKVAKKKIESAVLAQMTL